MVSIPLINYLLFTFIFFLGGLILWGTFKFKQIIRERNLISQSLQRVNKIILEELDFETVAQKIADAIPNELSFATGVLAILDNDRRLLRRVAASRTKEADEAIKALTVPFAKIEISLDDPNNLMAKSIREKKPFITNDSYDVLGPVLTRDESKVIQQIMGTKTTLIYPLYMDNKPVGVFLTSTKKYDKNLKDYELEIIRGFIEGAAIALQHSLLYKSIKETSEQLKVANEQLKQLDKLKDEFVSLASHELRTPMTAIKSYLWMALAGKGGKLAEKQKYYLDHAYKSTDRLIKLVNDMLNVSRIESGRVTLSLQAVKLDKLVSDVVTEIMPRAQELGVSLIFTPPVSLPDVEADPDKIREVLINLIGNSLKFTPKAGSITISFSIQKDMVVTKVSDTGAGITKQDIPKLFQKFAKLGDNYLVKQNSQGTGLGLYISKGLIELHGGKIWVESGGLGKGATFYFSLRNFATSRLKSPGVS